jgi:hypothetical protein
MRNERDENLFKKFNLAVKMSGDVAFTHFFPDATRKVHASRV